MTRSNVALGTAAVIILLYALWMSSVSKGGEAVRPFAEDVVNSAPPAVEHEEVKHGVAASGPAPAGPAAQVVVGVPTPEPTRHDRGQANTAAAAGLPVQSALGREILPPVAEEVGSIVQLRAVRENMAARVAGADPPPPWIADLGPAPAYASVEPEALNGTRVCGLRPCMMHSRGATRLFLKLANDGCGSRLLKILRGMAVAAKARMNFGGATVRQKRYPNGIDFHRLLDDFFGGPGAAEILRPEIPDKRRWRKKLWKLPDLYAYDRPAGDLIFITGKPLESAGIGEFPPDFLAALRVPFAARATAFAAGRPSVAMHVRRGDLPRWDRRVYAFEFFYGVAAMIRKHLPEADIHIFSNTLKDHMPRSGVWERIVMYNASEFNGFSKRGMTVHLDDSDLMVPWTHFIRAHVFVSSDSSFSQVPMLINPNCVISNQRNDLVVPTRNIYERDARPRNKQLQRCLRQIGLTSSWSP